MLYALKHLSIHWENVKDRQCALTPPEEPGGQDQRIFLRDAPTRKAGEHARSCFRVNQMDRPIRYIENNFQPRDHCPVNDEATGLIGQIGGSENPVDRQGADRYIDRLNFRKYAGIGTWRLPTVNELISLFDHTENMERYCRPAVFNPIQARLWSCDWRSDTTAWYVNMELDFVGWQDASCFYYVRGVSTAGR
jgi:serine/threonine-protein kinase